MECWRKAPFFGSNRGLDLLKKISALVKGSSDDIAPKDVIDRLYAMLGILDAKATGLLQVNSFFIAILIGILGFTDEKFKSSLPSNFTMWAERALIPLVASSIFCLLVVRVNWKFLRNASEQTGGYNFDHELTRLSRVADNRTHYYWFAWYGAIIGFLMPGLAWIF